MSENIRLDLETFCRRYGFYWDPSGTVDMTKAIETYIAYLANPLRYGNPITRWQVREPLDELKEP